MVLSLDFIEVKVKYIFWAALNNFSKPTDIVPRIDVALVEFPNIKTSEMPNKANVVKAKDSRM